MREGQCEGYAVFMTTGTGDRKVVVANSGFNHFGLLALSEQTATQVPTSLSLKQLV